MAANRLVEKLSRRLLISLLGKQKINGLAEFVDGPVEIFPLALDADVGLIEAPTRPHRALAAMECFLLLKGRQFRVRTLNGELAGIYKRWYPGLDTKAKENAGCGAACPQHLHALYHHHVMWHSQF